MSVLEVTTFVSQWTKDYNLDLATHFELERYIIEYSQYQLDAERKRIVNAIDAIVGMNPSFDMHLYAQAIKASVWNDEDEPKKILERELRKMPK